MVHQQMEWKLKLLAKTSTMLHDRGRLDAMHQAGPGFANNNKAR